MPAKTKKNTGARPLPGLEAFGAFDDAPTKPEKPRAPSDDAKPVERAKTPHTSSSAPRGLVAALVERVVDVGLVECAPVDFALDVGVREVLALDVAHFVGLPLASTLHAVTRRGVRFVVTTSRGAYAAARERGEPVFVGGELLALAHAAQNDRMFATHFDDAVARKQRAPDWRCTPAFALGDVHDAKPLALSFAAFFDRVGARLVGVDVASS